MPSENVTIKLNLSGREQVTAGLSSVATAIGKIRTEEKRAGSETSSFLGQFVKYNLAYSAISKVLSGIDEIATGTVALGVKTASADQQASVAFTNLLGSQKASTAYIAKMQQFASTTPFAFTDVEKGAQRLMAMGIQAKDVLPDLTAIGDTVAGMGGDATQINQITLALGQIQAKGRVMGQELLQLQNAGVPALKVLAAEYGVTTGKMQDMITAGELTADKAIPALIDGLEHGTKTTQAFGGMMQAQSHTIAGEWSNIQDNVSQGLAGLVKPWESAMSGIEDSTQNALQPSGGLFKLLADDSASLAARAPGAIQRVESVIDGLPDTLRHAQTTAENFFVAFEAGWLNATDGVGFHLIVSDVEAVTHALIGGAGGARQLERDARTLGTDLGFLAAHVHDVTWMLRPAIGAFIAYKAAGMLAGKVTAVMKTAATVNKIVKASTEAMTAAELANTETLGAMGLAQGELTLAQRLGLGSTRALAGGMAGLDVAMDANPIGLVVLAIEGLIALGYGLYELYQHWMPFHDAVDETLEALEEILGLKSSASGYNDAGTKANQKKNAKIKAGQSGQVNQVTGRSLQTVAGAKAAGGFTNPMSSYTVNEDGTETFTPSVPGRIGATFGAVDAPGSASGGAGAAVGQPIVVVFQVGRQVLAQQMIDGVQAIDNRR